MDELNCTVPARFVLLRRENSGLLEMMPDDVWRLKGRHDEYGELSLRGLIEDYIARTAKHLDQMRCGGGRVRSLK